MLAVEQGSGPSLGRVGSGHIRPEFFLVGWVQSSESNWVKLVCYAKYI